MGAQVLFLGLDSVEPALLQRWVDAGDLPNLAALIEDGLYLPIVTNDAIGDGAFWPTVYTGVNVARHGRYFHTQIHPGTYGTSSFDPDDDLRFPPFWKKLSDLGKRIAVIDVFRGPILDQMNGIQIVDWYTHGYKPATTRTSPPELLREICEKYGPDPFEGDMDGYVRLHQDMKKSVELLKTRIRAKTDLCRDLLAKKATWDLFFVVFGEPHDIGHTAWHLHDPSHPLHDHSFVQKHGDPLNEIYVAVDEAVGSVISAAGDRARVVVLAGLGMESGCTANYVLDELLIALERSPTRIALGHLKAALKRLLPTGSRRLLSTIPRSLRGGLRPPSAAQGRARRKCFAVPHNEHAGAIRLNLKGREPNGSLEPGSEADAYCHWLERQLLALREPGTGRRIVRRVIRSRDAFEGEALDELPDLFVVWNRPFASIRSMRAGTIKVEPSFRTGDHSRNAALLLGESGLTEGVTSRLRPEDVAPMVMEMLDASLDDVDGVVPKPRSSRRASPLET